MKTVDVAIIGGSLAGAACVRELARRGIDAVAFERERFPREKVCGGFVSPGAVELLEELEVLDAVLAAGATIVRASTIRVGRREISVELPRMGLGISRGRLDAIVADHSGVRQGFVRAVNRDGNMFRVQLEEAEISARIVVDAAGKLSRFSQRRGVPEFGVQFYETGSRGDVLDFWFFEEGYGGAVTVEGNRTNACFLVSKAALQAGFGGSGNCLVTGPLAYDRLASDFISIGDAAGMVDPFCGEGMRHALATGICAARAIATGLSRGDRYDAMRARYEQESGRRWAAKRRLGKIIRHLLKHRRLTSFGLGLSPEFWFRKLWD